MLTVLLKRPSHANSQATSTPTSYLGDCWVLLAPLVSMHFQRQCWARWQVLLKPSHPPLKFTTSPVILHPVLPSQHPLVNPNICITDMCAMIET